MKHYGDITKLDGHNLPLVDIVTGGSPCQDLSVAGKRAGLAGERSGLFMEQVRIIKEMRDESTKQLRLRGADFNIRDIKPRYMVWENVPGAFSSNKGEDFRCVLEETAKIVCENAIIPGFESGKWTPSGCIMGDGWSIAWRVHDAQFWGVPQRRKRISLVADFGGDTAPQILFESEGLSGDSEKSGEAWEGVAGDIGESTKSAGVRILNSHDSQGNQIADADGVYPTLRGCGGAGYQQGYCFQKRNSDSEINAVPASYTLKIRGGVEVDSHGKKAGKGPLIQTELSGTLGVSQDQTLITKCLNPWDVQSKHIQPENGVAEALYAGECRYGGGESYVMQPQAVVYGMCSYDSNSMKSPNPHSGIYEAETTRTLDNNGGNPACNQGGMIVLEGNGSRPSHKGDGYAESDIMYTLNSTEHHAVAVESFDNYNLSLSGEVHKTLQSEGGGSGVNEGCVLIENHPADSRVQIKEDGIVQTLSGRMGTGGNNVPMVMEEPYNATTGSFMRSGNSGVAETLAARDYKDPQIVCQSVVRRLTPMECERLQGYPDHWTDIGEWTDSKGKKHKDADSPRYKALGNSIALPFWAWMAKRMVQHLDTDKPTMASLFDGIGGFPLVYSRAGCEPVWASEIEEFPIAVTKIRFPE